MYEGFEQVETESMIIKQPLMEEDVESAIEVYSKDTITPKISDAEHLQWSVLLSKTKEMDLKTIRAYKKNHCSVAAG